jgi:hypothetical protein
MNTLTFSIISLSLTTLSILGLSVTLSVNDIQHNKTYQLPLCRVSHFFLFCSPTERMLYNLKTHITHYQEAISLKHFRLKIEKLEIFG